MQHYSLEMTLMVQCECQKISIIQTVQTQPLPTKNNVFTPLVPSFGDKPLCFRGKNRGGRAWLRY